MPDKQESEKASGDTRTPHPSVKRSRRRWLILGLAPLAALLLLPRRWFTMNDITTGQTPEYPDMPAHVYAEDVEHVRAAAEAACAALPRWRVVPTPTPSSSSPPPVQAEVRTLLFGFVDDVTVRFESLPDAAHADAAHPRTRVIIRSHSRVGKGDLGENERHIRALQAAMAARLHRVREF